MKKIVILDRDGVINEMVVHPEHGTIDSPLHPSQVKIFPWVPQALKNMVQAGFHLAIATNQPAAAKGKTTRKNLEEVHQKILAEIQSADTPILSSQICWHRSEDQCACRKPNTGMLEAVFAAVPDLDKSSSWMVGDGVTDIQAGQRFGLQTAYLGPQKSDRFPILKKWDIRPLFWGETLLEFSEFLQHKGK